MRKRQKYKDLKEKISISLNKSLIDKIDKFLDDEGLREDKINRSIFIQDILIATFKEFEKKGENSIIGKEYPLDKK